MAKVKIDKLSSLRMSRKIGRLDGREGLPDLSVTKPHSPFLAELKSVGEPHFSQVSQNRSKKLSSLDENIYAFVVQSVGGIAGFAGKK